MLFAKSLSGTANSVDYRSIHAILATTSSWVLGKFGIHQCLLGRSKCVLSDMLLAKTFTMSMLQLSTILVTSHSDDRDLVQASLDSQGSHGLGHVSLSVAQHIIKLIPQQGSSYIERSHLYYTAFIWVQVDMQFLSTEAMAWPWKIVD